MEIPKEYRGKYFYHFTHIDNIESIVNNGILSTNEKKNNGIEHENLANENIQERRSRKDVPCKPYGKIHDYVPFYFTAPNPMLISVLNRKNIDQPLVVYIAIPIEKLLEDNVMFTDRAANTELLPNFYKDPINLKELKWDLIDNTKWTEKNKEDLNSRMAEVLVYKKVPIDWIESYIVYNDICKDKIKEIYKENGLEEPKISYGYFGFNERNFYFTKFFIKEKKYETLVTGPVFLKNSYKYAIEKIINKRQEIESDRAVFLDIDDALVKIEKDFCVINELEGIYQLETRNCEHNNNVSDHTIQVVNNLENNKYYNQLCEHDKAIVKLAAYLHDIGKGPKSKWKDGIQPAYADHPADSIPMIKRILIEDFKEISNDEIKKICLLVFYHDLIGDIIKKGRSKEELLNLEVDENELNMLIALTIADVSAINSWWTYELEAALPQFKEEILENDRVCIR